jgi:hypothetical protein
LKKIFLVNSHFYTKIKNSTAHSKSREDNAEFVLENPEYLHYLMELCFQTNDKTHIRATAILEKLFEIDIELSKSYIESICTKIADLKNDSAIRSVSRHLMFLVQDNEQKRKSNLDYLTQNQLDKIAEASFDWLISDYRIAVKHHAMYTLLEIGKQQDWIYPEMKIILEKDAPNHSIGYKVVAKKMMGLMK